MASSLAGITMSQTSGSPSVSTMPTTGMPMRRASRTALASVFGSTTTSAPGSRNMSRMPWRLRQILRFSRKKRASSLLFN